MSYHSNITVMDTTQDARTQTDYKTLLTNQGRSVNWLVAQLNRERAVSRQYVSGLLNGKFPITDEWARLLAKVLDLHYL